MQVRYWPSIVSHRLNCYSLVQFGSARLDIFCYIAKQRIKQSLFDCQQNLLVMKACFVNTKGKVHRTCSNDSREMCILSINKGFFHQCNETIR